MHDYDLDFKIIGGDMILLKMEKRQKKMETEMKV